MPNNITEWFSYIEEHYQYSQYSTEERFTRFCEVAKEMHLDGFGCPVITVTGTNGKGSCVVFLEQILKAQGYNVGSYISPHLIKFNERIRLNGIDVDDLSLLKAFDYVDQHCREFDISYFEFTTLVAFFIFKNTMPILDVVVLEIGLGGRLDAVNAIDADIAIITTIALDHTEQLGGTRELIALEKAQIMRKSKFAVCGDRNTPYILFKHAYELDVAMYVLKEDFDYFFEKDHWIWRSFKNRYAALPMPNLPILSASVALMAIELLPLATNLKQITSKAIEQGIKNAFLPGRFQQIKESPIVILDVAHNPEAAIYLADRLVKLKRRVGRILGVVGMLMDKDIRETLKPLVGLLDIWYIGSLNQKRGATAEELAKKLQEFEVKLCYTHSAVAEAYKQAVLNSNVNDAVVVFGSFFTVAEIVNSINK